MKKILLLLFVISFWLCQAANAQQKTRDDSTEVINAGRRYGATFRLRSKDLKKFRAEHFPPASDYFKPDRRTPKVLANDSLFVKTYKAVAYDRALDQQSFPGFQGLLPPNHLRPGESQNVYASPVQQAAQDDAQKFSLDKAMLIRFKAKHFPANSDYFNPTPAYTTDPAMLKDSSYVQTFKFEAYSRAYHQRENPTGHGILIGSIIAAGTALLVACGIALSRIQTY